ncbi:MAG: putative metal-dependent hydrolase [Limisphaerales bacterium]|jgi:predicted metal-dependent hydrolase
MDFLTGLFPPSKRGGKESLLPVEDQLIPLLYVHNSRARHYILRLTAEGVARVTIPWGGSKTQALEFARTKTAWLARQLKRTEQRRQIREWRNGSKFIYRGEWVKLEVKILDGRQCVHFADQSFAVAQTADGLKAIVEKYLRRIADQEIPELVFQAARAHEVTVSQVQIRNQRSRWGSCSSKGTISLNWRLVQTPDSVRDYLIIHELMHTREMNHSDRYWAHVKAACPAYEKAETWLNKHSDLLR